MRSRKLLASVAEEAKNARKKINFIFLDESKRRRIHTLNQQK
jgi:hypothetical protein